MNKIYMPKRQLRSQKREQRLEELQRIFYPLVDEIYSSPGNQTNWVAVFVWDMSQKDSVWPYSCTEAWKGVTNMRRQEASHRREVFELLRKYSIEKYDLMEPFSKVVFQSSSDDPIIFSSSLSRPHSRLFRTFIINFMNQFPLHFPKALQFVANEWDVDSLFREVTRVSEEMVNEVKQPLDSFVENLRREFNVSRRINLQKLMHFLVWLYLHDPTGKYWIYLPYPKMISQGYSWGGIMICQGQPPEDETLCKFRDLTRFCFDLLSYDEVFRRTRGNGIYQALSRAEWIADKLFIRHLGEMETHIANFDIEKQRTRLIELEKLAILKPLSWAAFHEPNIRWISAFGWHALTNELYRIGWDFCPGKPADTLRGWQIVETRKRRFRALARLFPELVGSKITISLGDVLFTRCRKKRPIVITYNKKKDALFRENKGYKTLADLGDFVFLSIRSFYNPFKDKLKEISVEDLEQIEAREFLNIIKPHLGRFEDTTISALESEAFSDFQKLQPRISAREKDAFLRQMTYYLPWLILHDLQTRFVVYFPSLIKQDVPAGGIMIGFRKSPPAEQLVRFQKYVTKIFTKRSYILSQLVPEFPEVLTEAPFAQKVDQMLLEVENSNNYVSFAYIDLDDLRRINSEFGGHTAGTLAIKALITSIRRKMVETVGINRWTFARYGGDQFMLAVKGTAPKELSGILEKVREELKDKSIVPKLLSEEMQRYEAIAGGELKDFDKAKFRKLDRLSFSCGLASSSKHSTYTELRQAADNAADVAKQVRGKGRTRLCPCGCTK